MHLADLLHFLLIAFYLLVVLGIMVLVHEFGHFAVAKLCGVRVETFSIGFGKRLFGFHYGETDYRISVLPFGGYVKMTGDNPGEESTGDDGEFNGHPRWQRILIALAGPVANFVFAFCIMTVIALNHHEVDQYLDKPATVDWVIAKTPAASIGLQPGDTIVHYNAIENPDWRDVEEQSRLNLNQTLPISYVHAGKRVNTILFVQNTGSPDDFDIEHLGLVPVYQETPVTVETLEANMPAAEAGLQPGDQIVSMDGIKLHSVPALLAYMQDQSGRPEVLSVLRNSTPISLLITPQLADSSSGTKQFRLGFRAIDPPTNIQQLTLGAALADSAQENWHNAKLVVQLFHSMFGGRVSVKSLSGPIGIGQQIGFAVKAGWWEFLELMAAISLQLGLLNLMPFPILDGGMILFLLVESVIRRDVNQALKEHIYQAAFVVLILFFAFVMFNDISKFPFFAKLKL
ncbi:MAG TPA: RIP metalloprotease RseP [Acidobacteriaceae bacterium]|jgi:regulator of sigma E protease|nr:RIP metalloprotease RseP [Acidobacteriaceae bacterium]